MKRLLLLSAVPLLAAPAVLAAPPLSIPVPRPTPEQEEMIRIAEEEAQFLAEAEEAAAFAAAHPAGGEPAPAPEASAATAAPAATTVGIAEPAPVPPFPAPPAPGAVPEAPPEAAALPTAAPAAEPAPVPPEAEAEEEPEEFRRDPFWPVALVRARKAEHDARIAARIESEKRRAAIEKARQEAAVLGLDVSEMSDEALADIYGEDAPPDRSKGATSFAGATDGEWVAAEARIPPRSGYLGGKRPALMLKGDKRPHFEGDDICVTNHGVVFTWRISKVDFRAYSHELERVSAQSVIP